MRIGEVSSRTGVAASTLRAWEQHYGVLRPARTKGGQRRYREADVERVLAVRRLTADGLTLAAAANAVRRQHPPPTNDATEDQLYLTVMAASREGVWAVGPDARTTFVNARMAEMLGREAGEMIGVALVDLLHDDARECAVGMFERRRPGVAERHQCRFVHVDGSEIWTSMSSVPLYDHHGSFAGAVAVVTDITEQKRAEDAQRFQHRLLDAVGQAVIATDPQGVITYWNRAAEDLYGWRRGETLGRNVAEITPAEGAGEQLEVAMTQLRDGRTWQGDFPLRRRDGSEFVGSVTTSAVFDDEGHLVSLIGVSMDVTERRSIEAEAVRRAAQQETVALLGVRALAGLHLDELLSEATQAVALALGVEVCEVLHMLPNGTSLVVASTSETRCGAVAPAGLHSLAGYTFLRRAPAVSDDLALETRFAARDELTAGFRSGAAVAVDGLDGPHRVLVALGRSPRAYTGEDVSFLQAVANVLAATLDHERIADELSHISRVADLLT